MQKKNTITRSIICSKKTITNYCCRCTPNTQRALSTSYAYIHIACAANSRHVEPERDICPCIAYHLSPCSAISVRLGKLKVYALWNWLGKESPYKWAKAKEWAKICMCPIAHIVCCYNRPGVFAYKFRRHIVNIGLWFGRVVRFSSPAFPPVSFTFIVM